MTGTRPVVWVVASERVGQRLAHALAADGFEACPLAWCVPVPPVDRDALLRALEGTDADLVLLTSRHALAFLPPDAGRGLRAACVGPGTAAAARGRGFEVALVGSAGARSLAELVVAEAPAVGRVLFLAAREAREEGPEVLARAGIEVTTWVAYGMDRREALADEVRAAPAPGAVVVGSPRAADALLDVAGRVGRGDLDEVPFVVLGEVTAAHVAARLGRRPAVASPPDAAGVAAVLHTQLEAATPHGGEEETDGRRGHSRRRRR